MKQNRWLKRRLIGVIEQNREQPGKIPADAFIPPREADGHRRQTSQQNGFAGNRDLSLIACLLQTPCGRSLCPIIGAA